MNFKFLFPTFLNRYYFVENVLHNYGYLSSGMILNIGTGEGDYDPMIARYCRHLIGCDHNEQDLAFANERNRDIANLEYKLEDALHLSYPENTFDRVIAIEVVEHVNDPLKMLHQIYRVLKPEGLAILTFPNDNFPMTYDPVNRVLSWISDKHLPIGAYAFGHTHLITSQQFRNWATTCGFTVVQELPLSGYLVGLLEVYWTGLVQRLFKFNASNKPKHDSIRMLASRPGNKIPRFSHFVRKITDIDRRFFNSSKQSIGRGFVLQKGLAPAR